MLKPAGPGRIIEFLPLTSIPLVLLLLYVPLSPRVLANAQVIARSSVHDDASYMLLSYSAHDRSRKDAVCHGPKAPSALHPAIAGHAWLGALLSARQ